MMKDPRVQNMDTGANDDEIIAMAGIGVADDTPRRREHASSPSLPRSTMELLMCVRTTDSYEKVTLT
jgi:hypothetical protein